MNFLAHLYLSFGDRDIMIGNFIADHIKGRGSENFPPAIQNGILLHRAIDTFTDAHPVVAETKSRLREGFRKYAPVIADVYYDHFLATDWHELSEIPLDEFADSFYKLAFDAFDILPDRTRQMLPIMQSQNWLQRYRTIEGLHTILLAMSRRTPFESNMEHAAAELEKNYHSYQKEFRAFFPELVAFSRKELERHHTSP